MRTLARVDTEAWERAIFNHMTRVPAITGEGRLYVKIAFHEREPEDDALYGELFLSMPHPGADTNWMQKVMQHVRDGFECDEIDVPYRVTLNEPQQPYAHVDDEVNGVLLTLPATFSAQPH